MQEPLLWSWAPHRAESQFYVGEAVLQLHDFNPLKAIAIPNIGRVEPKGLTVVIGPNSAGKTQILKDIHGRVSGQARKLVVCGAIDIQRPNSLNQFLEVLHSENHIARRYDTNGNALVDSRLPHLGGENGNWTLPESHVQMHYNNHSKDGNADEFFRHFGRSFITSLFLDRRLAITASVNSFDYETQHPSNELQALYMNEEARKLLTEEARTVFGKAIWLDATRGSFLSLRVGDGPEVPSAEDRLSPSKMRNYRMIEEEGDGLKSYMCICLTLLLGRRPVVLIDEPEMCLHPPQAYALGRFIGKYGSSPDHTTLVATHSSYILRGIIEETERLEIVRLSRVGSQFSGKLVSRDILKESIEKPSTKSENVLDGMFAEAVTVVESEGDRLVYGTTWNRVANEFDHDVHFVSVGGLGGIADPCVLYNKLKIPLCVIVDLDVIRNFGTFENILKAVAPSSTAQEIMSDARRILEAVKKLGPLFNETETKDMLNSVIAETLDWNDAGQLKRIRDSLSDLSDGLSQTARLKQGIESLKSYQIYYDLDTLLNTCRGLGVFLVPVGELEGWVSQLVINGPSKKRKKAEWANYAASKIRESPVQQDDVWDFIRKMATFQQAAGARLAGYPSPKALPKPNAPG